MYDARKKGKGVEEKRERGGREREREREKERGSCTSQMSENERVFLACFFPFLKTYRLNLTSQQDELG